MEEIPQKEWEKCSFFGKNKTSVLSLQGCTVFPMIRPSNQKQEKKAILHNLALHIWISSTF